MAGAATGYAVRRGGMGDGAAVHQLFCRSFAATFGHNYQPGVMERWLAETCPPARFEQECTSPDFAVFLAEGSDGRLLGHCTLGPYDIQPDTRKSWWVLRQLYLDEPAKGIGLGDRLLAEAIGESRARGHQVLYLTVWIENHRARRFYERHGFVEVGRYAYAVGDQIDDDRILRLTL